jgi:hypothetical protein
MPMNGPISSSAIHPSYEQQIAQYPFLLRPDSIPWLLPVGKLLCIILTIESTIMDIAMGTEETDLLNSSL